MAQQKTAVAGLIVAATVIGIIAAVIVGIRVTGDTPATTVAGTPEQSVAPRTPPTDRTFKVLYVMSYHTPWEWTDDQFQGFKDALSGLNVEYKVYELDAKRRSSKEWLEQAGKQARQLIDEWKPDLVYTSDDAAQEYVTKYYINSDIPFVFSAVNATPDEYGFTEAKNITGVLEREHVTQSIQLLREIVPNVRRIALISDPAPMWRKVAKRMIDSQKAAGVQIVADDVAETFEDWKRLVNSYPGKADAIAMLGVFNVKGPDGNNLPFQEIGRWMAENSKLPDFSFWKDRVSYGALCGVAVSGYAQGNDAGKLARSILVEGKSPSDFPMVPTVKGEPVISLPRARFLGISPDSEVLLTAKVFAKYGWE